VNHIRTYLEQLQQTLDDLPHEPIEQVISLLERSRVERRQVIIMGNGGSASTATHFVCDLAKNTRRADCPRFCAIGLSDNMAIFSAYANDEGYENVFAQQLANIVRPDDVVIGISASGNSPNVVRAIELANELGATTVGFTGFDGGRVGKIVNIHVHVASNVIEHVEDVHLSLEHMICKALREQPLSESDQGLVAKQLEGIDRQTALTTRSEARELVELKARLPKAGTALELLAQLSRELEGQPDLGALLQKVLRLALYAVAGTSGSLVLLAQDGNVIESALANGDKVLVAEGLEETVRRGLAGWVVENRVPTLVGSTMDDPRWLRRDWEEVEREPRSAASVPLIAGERVAGVMTVVRRATTPFNQDDLALLTTIASCVFLAGVQFLTLPSGLRSERSELARQDLHLTP
jgi:D-sedoheptulose 7-phosphate isomerase